MGQEAGKAAWPKPSGGYQTVTGRRYGRRHAYISFKPSLESPNRTSARQKRESEGLELGSVQKENESTSSESHDSSFLDVDSVVTDLQDSETLDSNDSLSLFSEAFKPSSSYPVSEGIKECPSLNNSNPCKESSKTFLMATPLEHAHHSNSSDSSFVNIDSFEPDSSEGEESVSLYEDFSLKSESWRNMQLVNKALDELQREVLSECSDVNLPFTENSLSQGIVALSKYPNLSLYSSPWSLSASSVSEDDAVGISRVELCDSEQKNNRTDLMGKTTPGMCSEVHAKENIQIDPESEPVVRPKIRKSYPSGTSGKSPLKTDENGKDVKSCRSDKWEVRAPLHKPVKVEEVHSAKEQPDYGNGEGNQKKLKGTNKDNLTVKEDKPLVDDTFWDDFEVYGLKIMDPVKDEDSSECSDGEWSTCLPSYFSGDKDHSSSDESWETLPGKEEHEVRSNSSSLEEENSDFCFQVEEQNSLEDGEIPWLQYQEDIESSTDEENEISSHLPPGFFILDGNNNLEDDSSMSEDLEVEWRLLDDFGDGIGVAQAMSYMDPQFLTYMALEERLAQAMETALAHLESLAVDMEQAHPPATKESIDCLPQIVLTNDHIIVGQEQCCAICCSEYIKDEILTELPCRHLFHKPCVSLWLQKSGTCPVCRHVLTSVFPEATAATSFLSDHDESPPSIHNAAGTR